MKRAVLIGVLVVLAFVTIVLVRAPASWISGALPSNVTCAQLSGTVWNGMCSGLIAQSKTLGDLKWQLHPLALLGGKVSTDVEIAGPFGSAAGQLEARSGTRFVARALRADFMLNPALVPQMPHDLRGSVQTDLTLLRVEKGIITALEGRIDARNLERRDGALGDYTLSFPPGTSGEPVGELRSMAGPLDVEGKLRLTREPGFVLEGVVAAKGGASPEMIRQLEILGTPDASGRRPFSVAGTF